jgi:hypothetical protein
MSSAIFEGVGTDKLVIGRCKRMGSSTLDRLAKDNIVINNITKKFSDNRIYVVLIRDVIDKWKSGYMLELRSKHAVIMREMIHYIEGNYLDSIFFNRLENKYYETFTDPDIETCKGIEALSILHNVYNNISWMYQNHAEFWLWNNEPVKSLWELALKPNVYFLDLKYLGNPRFLEWLQEKDEVWKEVKEISHLNKTPDSFWKQMDIFWTEYSNKLILRNKILTYPFETLGERDGNNFVPEFFVLHQMADRQQCQVNYIRKNSERYLDI